MKCLGGQVSMPDEAPVFQIPALRISGRAVDQPEALALYKRYGFVECGPFGGYEVDPLSLFMKKAL